MSDQSQAPGVLRGPRYSLRSLFVWMVCVAVPLACFRPYYAIVTNTADGRTSGLFDATPYALVFFVVGAVFVLVVFIVMLSMRRFLSAFGMIVAIALCIAVAYPVLTGKKGDPNAQLHNDAAALAAMAVRNHFQRVGKWPRSWDDLDQDVTAVASISYSLPSSTDLKSMPNPIHVNQASGMSIDDLAKLVDVDFNASPDSLAKQPWHEFSGVRARKPSFNYYRVQVQELIDCLAAQTDAGLPAKAVESR